MALAGAAAGDLREQARRQGRRIGLAEVTLVQALPLIVVTVLRERATAGPRWLWRLNVSLLLLRLGVLVGTARAYRQLPPTYWLSPLMDLPVALQLWRSVLTRRHRWRGRILVSGAAA